MLHQKAVVAERRVDLAVAAAGDHAVQLAHFAGGEDDVGRNAHDERAGFDPRERRGHPAPAAADVARAYTAGGDLDALIDKAREDMERAAKSLDFLAAAKFRDRMYELQKLREENRK